MAGFAGVRRSELIRDYAEDQVLKWEDVDWQKHLITVRHEVAKQTPRKMGNRRFIPMEAALLHRLGPYRKEEGLLIPLVDSAVRRRMKKLCLHSKVNPPNSAVRHSYAGELKKSLFSSLSPHSRQSLVNDRGANAFAAHHRFATPFNSE
jgi:integrase